VTIKLGDDSLNQTFSPLRVRCQIYVLLPKNFKGLHDIGCDTMIKIVIEPYTKVHVEKLFKIRLIPYLRLN
jgi:hypothetical protein